MDVMDVAGEQQNDLNQQLHKIRIDKDGKVIGEEQQQKKALKKACGNCYGARPPSTGCCNTCEEVRQAYLREGWALSKVKDVEQCVNEGWADELDFDKGEGCTLIGSANVNRVSGNIHFVPGKSYKQNNYHVHDVQFFQDRLNEFHFGHKISRLSFGEEFAGMSTPLDGYHREYEDGIHSLIVPIINQLI
jgi:endoplasmic reticulum-Golgi intermediate compartment protein 3